jgi:hypothetical protein
MDPRVKALPQEVAAQTNAELRIADATKKSAETVASVRGLQADLKALGASATGPVTETIAMLEKKLTAIAGEAAAGGRGARGGGGGGGGGRGGTHAGPPTLVQVSGEYASLYGLIDSADGRPTAAQASALQELNATFGKLMAQWAEVKSKDLPALNEQLKKAGMPALQIKAAALTLPRSPLMGADVQ